ncbi:MAG: TRAP transporter TatT component family protein [Sandaracinaceae bacterium]
MRVWTDRTELAMGKMMAMGMVGLGLVAFGCGGSYDSAWDEEEQTADTSGGSDGAAAGSERTTLIEQGDAAWAERDDAARIQAAITAWEQAVEMDGSDHETWVKISRAYYFLADGHQRFDNPDAMADTYQSGIRAAERALRALSPDFAQRMSAGEAMEEAAAVLEADAVPALYWRATNLGKWARADGFATLLSFKDEIRAVMTRCLELDRSYFFTGPDRYFGAFYAIAPSYAGGDLERSQQHFEYSISQQPNYFGTHVLMAENLAVKLQNREMFVEHLQLVIDGDPTALVGAEPENRVEQRKATELMTRVDDLFE